MVVIVRTPPACRLPVPTASGKVAAGRGQGGKAGKAGSTGDGEIPLATE